MQTCSLLNANRCGGGTRERPQEKCTSVPASLESAPGINERVAVCKPSLCNDPDPHSPLSRVVERLRAGSQRICFSAVERPATARRVSLCSRLTAAGGPRLWRCESRTQPHRVARAARSWRAGRATDPRLCILRASWTRVPRPSLPRLRGQQPPRHLRVESNAACNCLAGPAQESLPVTCPLILRAS